MSVSSSSSVTMQILTPHVYWAQRHGDIFLRVELSDASNLDISLQENNTLQFRAQGHGAKGDNEYEFSLEFLEAVRPEISHRSTQRQVDIKIKKQVERWWDRLTLQEKKPLFLAPDFDRWLDESDAEMELQAKEEKINRISVESRVRKDPYLGLKRGYLFMYNLVQFLGFSWIFVNMTVRLFILGQDSFYDTFHTTADMMYFCQMMAVLEVVNPLLGLVKTGFFPAMIQVAGRNVILFVIFGSLEEMQNKSVVFFVFYLWSTIEIFSFPLPALLGHSLSFSYTLQLYLVLMFLGLFINFRHLYKQRRRRYRSKKRKVH
ncbi:Very-long-chain (3R)-3-hydroxyacyl-CoA dehydratase [Collichthys lucidus]|uniref:Very-long-chain (3R)-3-hydroxyacyl-CoA dehydratase n=1 Tax=Collichthys lucidus TaxID=240159 RepID=A0A4U5U8B2_COLLU|nr:Very-long-chain (3R)-3-hydroxyacyl-CoA dehydratase [Collichthys lucidus]